MAAGLAFAPGIAPAPPLRAQEPPADPDLSTRDMRRAGPFHIRPSISLKDAGYDDNIRFDSATQEGDATATLGPGLSALLLTGDRGGILVSQEYDYVAFRDNTDLNHWNSRARARGILLLRRAVLSLEDRFTSLRERPNDEIDRRVRRGNNAVTAAVRTRGDGRLGLRAFARHERIDYSADEAGGLEIDRLLNRNENALSVQGELRIFPKTHFTLEGVAERIEFEDAQAGRDTRTLSMLPGLRFDPSAGIQGELKLGVARLEAPDSPQHDTRTTIGEGNLTARLGNHARLKGAFSRQLEFSVAGNNLYYRGRRWSAAYEQFFSRHFSGEVSFGRGLNDYPVEITGSNGILLHREDRLTTLQAAVRYRLNDQLSFVASAQRLERDSSDDGLDRERNLYAVGSTLGF